MNNERTFCEKCGCKKSLIHKVVFDLVLCTDCSDKFNKELNDLIQKYTEADDEILDRAERTKD